MMTRILEKALTEYLTDRNEYYVFWGCEKSCQLDPNYFKMGFYASCYSNNYFKTLAQL